MKTIFNIGLKLMQNKYGNSLYFVLLYQLGKSIIYFGGFAVWGMLASLLIKQDYFTQSIYEQLIIVGSFLFIFLFKKEKQYALIPIITKLTISKIRNCILIRELFSWFNLILFPLLVPVLFSLNTSHVSVAKNAIIFISLWLLGFFMNLSARIINFLCAKYNFLFITTLSILLIYSSILITYFRTTTVLSYSNFLENPFFSISLLIGILLLILSHFYVVKQELYQMYDRIHSNSRILYDLNSMVSISNIFIKFFVLRYLRCTVFKKISAQMFSYAIAGIIIYILFGSILIAIGMFIGIFTFNILPLTIYMSSNYFDGLYTKPISIKSLLLSSFFINIATTTLLFLIMLIVIIFIDNQLILPLISINLLLSGPIALLLLHNILYAQKIELFPTQPDFTVQQTFAQTVIKIIAVMFLLGGISIIHFFSTVGCLFLISISLATLITYSYLINILYNKFMLRRYEIMTNLR